MARKRGLVAAAILAACGIAAVSGTAAGTGAAGKPAAAAFRLADGSAGCNMLSSGTIACRAEGTRSALVLAADGGSRVDDTPVSWNGATRVLLDGESWWNGAFTCRAAETLVCSTGNGGQITVGRDGVGALAPAVTYELP